MSWRYFAAATAGGLVLGGVQGQGRSNTLPAAGFVLRAGTDVLFPLLLIAGLYVVIHGHLTPGGGFQGGVILAAAFFLAAARPPEESLSHIWLSVIEGLAGTAFIALGLGALYNGDAFLTPLFDKGVFGELVSSGSLPLLYLAVGLKVGAELSSLLMRLAHDDGAAS